MTKARTRTSRFPQHPAIPASCGTSPAIRRGGGAFACYCAGFTRAEVVYRLRLQYGDRAPSPATVKRWMEQEASQEAAK